MNIMMFQLFFASVAAERAQKIWSGFETRLTLGTEMASHG